MSTLERAIEIAAAAHAGHEDKAGAPYILHPLRVMLRCEGEPERIAAVLHDVVEDSDWTLEGLRAEGFAKPVIAALACLTKEDGEGYSDFVARVRRDPIARAVKIADLEDNLDPTRIRNPGPEDRAREKKYRAALASLQPGPDGAGT